MKHLLLSAAIAFAPCAAHAETSKEVIAGIVGDHIAPRFASLDTSAKRLSSAVHEDCDPTSKELRHRYGMAMDAWVSVSHLRFGPTEVADRAFALAFWPDSRGATPRTLATLIADQDPIVTSSEAFATVSIAARGLYAMEYLLYDEVLRSNADLKYFCTLIQAVADDIQTNSAAIRDGWDTNYAQRLLEPTPDGTYRSEEEVLQELFKALTTGLEFTAETRLGRPLGTYDRPRPNRAESWRSARSKTHVMLSLSALRDLALHLSTNDAELRSELEVMFDAVEKQLDALKDPTFAGVADPQSRFKIEVIQQSVDAIRGVVRDTLGPTLGVAAGFNSLDGD